MIIGLWYNHLNGDTNSMVFVIKTADELTCELSTKNLFAKKTTPKDEIMGILLN